jgi:hypothetical protein
MIILLFSLTIEGCQKPDEEVKDQKSIFFNEQAFPGVKGVIQYFITSQDTITCEKINDNYVFQGDIILTEQQILELQNGSGIESLIKKWPNNTVYYSIKNTFPYKSRITKAIQYWEANTSIKFREYSLIAKSYVEFIWDKKGCYSNLGMANEFTDPNIYGIGLGRQVIGLADWADVGTVIHEIGHTLGLLHENSRYDRDNYIMVNLNNIEAGKEHNFNKFKAQYKASDFDFNSIMLCSSYSFSMNGFPTITKSDGTTYDAQREYLSEEDKNTINLMYFNPGNGR